MVTISMGYVDDFGLEVTRTLWNGCSGGKWGAGDFERNLRRWPKSTVHSYQGSTSGDVQRGGKLK